MCSEKCFRFRKRFSRKMCSVLFKRVTALVIGILDMLVAGSIYSYNVYAPSLQLTFNFTQEEIDTIPSFGHLGFCVGVPAGLLRYKCGSTLLSVIGFVVSTTGYLLIWSTFLSTYVYHYKSWLMSFYYFVVGHGLVYLYMEALITNMKNFPKRHRGTVVGFMDAIFGASNSFFVLVYKLAFAKSFWFNHEEEQNLVGFILFLSASCGFAGIISVVGLREYKDSSRRPSSLSQIVSIPDVREYTAPAYEYPGNESESSSTMADDDENDDAIPIVGTRPRLRFIVDRTRSISADQRRSITPESIDSSSANLGPPSSAGLELLKSFKFHCLIWPFITAGGVCFVVVTNIEYVLKSFGLDDFILTCLVVIAVSNGAARILCGVVSDRYVDKVPRVNVLFFMQIPLLVSTGFVIFYSDEAFVLVLWCVALGVAYGALWCLVPTIMSESYGMKYFGLNWGCVLFFSALFSLGLQRLFGYLYDLHVPQGSLFCEGVQCFRWSFVVFAVLVSISAIMTGALCKSNAEQT